MSEGYRLLFRLGSAFFIALVIIRTPMVPYALATQDEQSHNACFKYLIGTGYIHDIQPYIPWSAISDKVYQGGLRYSTGWLAERVFIKMEWTNPFPKTEFLDKVKFSKELSDAQVGPKFFGTTFNPQRHTWELIYQYIEGVDYHPNYRFYTNKNSGIEVAVPTANHQLPHGVAINRDTLRDINLAFDVLNSLNIKAVDIQFLFTKSGRAVLVDFGGFRRVSSSTAKRFNESLRKSIIMGIKVKF